MNLLAYRPMAFQELEEEFPPDRGRDRCLSPTAKYSGAREVVYEDLHRLNLRDDSKSHLRVSGGTTALAPQFFTRLDYTGGQDFLDPFRLDSPSTGALYELILSVRAGSAPT